TDARVRRDPATQEADVPDGQVMNKDVGQVERDLLVLAADFAQSDKLTASLRFSDGQWLNFTEPITPAGPILSWDSLPL
ncbi:MAG: osmolarity sensor protein EnvZ, partial [Mesorhizobium sp.]